MVQMKAAKVILLGCSQRTSNAAVRAELGIHSLKKKGRDIRRLKWQYRLRKIEKKKEKKRDSQKLEEKQHGRSLQKGRRHREWDIVQEKVWKMILLKRRR